MKPIACIAACAALLSVAGCCSQPRQDPEPQRQQVRDAMARATTERDAALVREGQTGAKPQNEPAK